MANNEEQAHAQQLNQVRANTSKTSQQDKITTKEEAKTESNIVKNLFILLTAVIFDVFALIPFVGVVFNIIFAGILILAYGKSSGKRSGTMKILSTSLIGSTFDFFFSILPINIVTALMAMIIQKKIN